MDGSISSPLRRKYSGPIRLLATTTEIPTFHLERGRDRVGGQHQKRDEGLDGLLGWRAGESREREDGENGQRKNRTAGRYLGSSRNL